jgi:Coenzyme PQQ synthesis protein D (PqqD)
MSSTMPPTIDENTRIARNENLLVTPVHNETLMMEVASERYYGLDAIGSAIWRRIDTPRTFGALVDDLAKEFAAERDTIARDVAAFLATMAEHNIVVLAQGS